ncbi:MAG: iron ABC transporter permease [Dehalococcoidales bacterium]|nr:iron ABC transporter permease [Dehalococcoidales bacterium]
MKRVPWVVLALCLLLVIGVFIGIAMGPFKLDFHQLVSAVLGQGDATATTLIWDLRLPRVAAALLVGACLGIAGYLLQTSTRNPLGDPQLFGLGGGAVVIQALAIAGIVGRGTWGLYTLSVMASLVGAAIIIFFASRQGVSPARLALIGVSLSALTAAIATGALAGARVFSQQSLNFVGGSLANRGWQDVLPALPFLGLGLLMAIPVLGNLKVLTLGDRVAANLGAEPGRTRAVAVASSGILGGTAVAVAGMVGFVGLMVPHVARLLVGHDVRLGFVVSILLGANVVLFADQVARLAFMPSEVPVGMITALLGAPLMIYVARRIRWN